jgi:hypothetical protein
MRLIWSWWRRLKMWWVVTYWLVFKCERWVSRCNSWTFLGRGGIPWALNHINLDARLLACSFLGGIDRILQCVNIYGVKVDGSLVRTAIDNAGYVAALLPKQTSAQWLVRCLNTYFIWWRPRLLLKKIVRTLSCWAYRSIVSVIRCTLGECALKNYWLQN